MKSEVEIQVEKETKLGETLVQRDLKVLAKDSDPMKVAQIHFLGWPDNGTPTKAKKDFLVVLNRVIGFLNDEQTRNQKVMVHCSAGIGRTGTTIILAILIIEIRD